MSGNKTFYDIHFHAMDLSHPNILAFTRRIKSLGPLMVLFGLLEPLFANKEEKIKNLLSVMENSIEDYFILLEYYLKNKESVINENNTFTIEGEVYDKIVLTPLLMDFGYKHIKENTFYNIPPGKPIVDQTVDILKAIQKYCNFYMVLDKDGSANIVPRKTKNNLLFEIYPFLGINTENYSDTGLKKVIEKYFSEYKGERKLLLKNMGMFDNSIENVGSNVFAGIKLYPPLGFDPWPGEKEIDKTKWLYDYCQQKQIPITAHCSSGGFSVDNRADNRSNPKKWFSVMKEFPNLKLNLAHMGRKSVLGIPVSGWRKSVLKLVNEYESVYTDFSCAAFDENYYKWLNKLIKRSPGSKEKVMFGSDFMINLMWSDSYNSYLKLFFKSKIDKATKKRLCQTNPETFLFRQE